MCVTSELRITKIKVGYRNQHFNSWQFRSVEKIYNVFVRKRRIVNQMKIIGNF